MPPSHPGLARKVKPLFRFYEREMAAYAIVRGIEYVYDECPFAEGATSIRYKEMLNELEVESPGIKLQFYLRFLNARKKYNLFQHHRAAGRDRGYSITLSCAGYPLLINYI